MEIIIKNAATAAQNVSTSQSEIMETQEGATTMVAEGNSNNSKNVEIMKNEAASTGMRAIDTLRHDVTNARREMEDYTGDKKTVQAKFIVTCNKAMKALRSAIEQQVMPKLPVQFWRAESDGQDAIMITKEDAEVIIAVSSYSLQTKSAAIKIAMQCLNNRHFELDASKYVTPAELLYNAGIELSDLNGNIIPKNTPNVYVPVGGADEHAIFYAAHKLNIDAEINDTAKIVLRNICVKTFDSIQKLGKYIGNNTALDRALNGMEQASIAALATEHELMQKVHDVATTNKWSKSTTEKYYRLGVRMTSTQWHDATCGIMPESIEYNLSVGDQIIQTLVKKGFESIMKNRYLIDAIAKFAKVRPFGKDEENGINATMSLLAEITEDEAGYILTTSSDKADILFNWLSQKQTQTSQQAT